MIKTAKAHMQENLSVDMNPMLDIVFILLIFFIVTASFNKEAVLDIERNNSPTLSVTPKVTPQFIIDASNKVYLNNRQVEIDAINVNIAKLAANADITAISVRAHESSQHNTLVTVLNAIKEQTSVPVALGDVLAN
ncbi:biopolymer transporter [Pseudoalteromonas phenolica]|uniref:ExbD/TolR family protein n=1 Tax=Pseudoalteromonas phenolica TaxID=161398 RepID=UPI00110ACFB4|nr:biopolymer transporter ExbD [Pseudoalteromonas phenolica]TMN93516.1 biopolymer transporter [Pseudoalteromonas phenolica]